MTDQVQQAKRAPMAERLEKANLPSIEKMEEMELKSTASKIRHLLTITSDRGLVAKWLGIRYQWVRNVANQKLSGE